MKTLLIIALVMTFWTFPANADDMEDCTHATGDNQIAACTRLIESGRLSTEDQAVAYYNRGIAKARRRDQAGAIADFTTAIERNPKYANAHNNRGIARARRHDLDGALDDFNRVIALDPTDTDAHVNRGIIRRLKGDLVAALSDFNRALELDPQSWMAYMNRGATRLNSGDTEGSIADYTRVLDLEPKTTRAHINRGRAYFHKGDLPAAAADFVREQQLQPNPHAAIWLYMTRHRSGTSGTEELAMNSRSLDASKWPAPVMAMFLGRLTPAEVMIRAKHDDPITRSEQLCEARFYIAQWHLQKHDRARALPLLRQARDQCPKDFAEQTGAFHELRRLGER